MLSSMLLYHCSLMGLKRLAAPPAMMLPSERGMRYVSVPSAVRLIYELFKWGAVLPSGTVIRQQMPLHGMML